VSRLAVLVAAAGGALGAVARYALGATFTSDPGAGAFPTTTFAINAAGSFLLGLLLAAAPGRWPPEVVLAVGTGFLGAFTTFSTFSHETTALVRAGHPTMAAAYVAASVVVGLAAAAAGHLLGRAAVS
jgi:fluoride exporter